MIIILICTRLVYYIKKLSLTLLIHTFANTTYSRTNDQAVNQNYKGQIYNERAHIVVFQDTNADSSLKTVGQLNALLRFVS